MRQILICLIAIILLVGCATTEISDNELADIDKDLAEIDGIDISELDNLDKELEEIENLDLS